MSKSKLSLIIFILLAVILFYKRYSTDETEDEVPLESVFQEVKRLGPQVEEASPKAIQVADNLGAVARSQKKLNSSKEFNEKISEISTSLKKKKRVCRQGLKELLPGGDDIFEMEDSFEDDFEGAIDTLDEMIILYTASIEGTQAEYEKIAQLANTAQKGSGQKLIELYNFEICPYEILVSLYELIMEKSTEKAEGQDRGDFKKFMTSMTLSYTKQILNTVPNSHHLMQVGYLLKTLGAQQFFTQSDRDELNFLVDRNVEEGQHLAVSLVQGSYKGSELSFFKESLNTNSLAKDDYIELIDRLIQTYQSPSSIQR